ncbi:hypothetical protein [Hyphomicrobium facile]|uniref:Uncharacterized protein n=1 Tax=Hyphomicrobium facile TaxID=51670 RepID=A0A1I7N5T7_9HYPH|nr:hypothetical protein [Hyphomicrobium facile]SFV30010.1 hypothetical protein SAMN04488557_1387 [Hyphomicrobium facile]
MSEPRIVQGNGEVVVQCAGGSKWCSVLLWEDVAPAERRLALVKRKDTGQVFAAKRKLDGWIELSWGDVMDALARDARTQDNVIEMLARAAVGE